MLIAETNLPITRARAQKGFLGLTVVSARYSSEHRRTTGSGQALGPKTPA